MIILFGLKACDTCRKMRAWLDARGLEHRSVDLRETPPDAELLDRWIDAIGHERLLNRRSTTWRELDPADRADVDAAKAHALMLARPTLIKRPVLDIAGRIHVGDSPESREAVLAAAGSGP